MSNDVLKHHGILGMRWGVRRTPEQLGHKTGVEGNESSDRKKEKASNRISSMSNEELQKRIARMNMEEQYINLLARQKARSSSKVKKLLGEAITNLAKQSLSKMVDKLIEKRFDNKDKPFDISKYDSEDITKMNADKIKELAKWYENASKVIAGREKLNPSSRS